MLNLDFCERIKCKHSVDDHPNDGPCTKCECVGFYRNFKVDDPLAKKYIQLIIDSHTKFNGVLDMASHLNENFPNMAKIFYDSKKVEEDIFWKQLVKEDYDLAKKVKTVIENFNKFGRTALEETSTKINAAISKLSHNGANMSYLSLQFIL